MAGLDPAIHHFERSGLTKEMDTRVKPAYDANSAATAIDQPRGVAFLAQSWTKRRRESGLIDSKAGHGPYWA
jgi:hypothetical protein